MAEAKTAKKTPKKAPTKTVKKPTTKTPTKAPTPKKSDGRYAVFATGGKQYRVQVGDTLKIEKISDEEKEGDKLTFDNVLLIDDGKADIKLGTPFISGAKVEATLSKISKGKKIEVVKYKAKSRYFKRYGHRQPFFEIQIEGIK